MCQSVPSRVRNMLRLTILLFLLSHRSRAYVTDTSFADRLDKLSEKLEKLTVAPTNLKQQSLEEKLYAKLDRLNSLAPEKVELTDEDEEVLSEMQVWGKLSGEQLEKVMKELQNMKEDVKRERLMEEYADGDWMDEDLQDIAEGDYANDDWEYSDPESGPTQRPAVVTPSAFTKLDPGLRDVVSAIDPIAATNERPRILDDSGATPSQRSAYLQEVISLIKTVVRANKCLTPQPRWLVMRQLAPAADTVYMPPCVLLHRCAPDSGCCYDESEVCAPVDGEYVTIPFYLNKADGNLTVARMVFFNHTRCACVSRDTLQSAAIRIRTETRHRDRELVRRESVISAPERQIDWRSTEEPILEKNDEATAPPQLRRCTCPVFFLARLSDSGCTCVCDWPEPSRKRDCLSLARGREHFGLRDRVCITNGDCTPPTCEYGAYERSSGRCPLRRYRRVRFHHRSKLIG